MRFARYLGACIERSHARPDSDLELNLAPRFLLQVDARSVQSAAAWLGMRRSIFNAT